MTRIARQTVLCVDVWYDAGILSRIKKSCDPEAEQNVADLYDAIQFIQMLLSNAVNDVQKSDTQSFALFGYAQSRFGAYREFSSEILSYPIEYVEPFENDFHLSRIELNHLVVTPEIWSKALVLLGSVGRHSHEKIQKHIFSADSEYTSKVLNGYISYAISESFGRDDFAAQSIANAINSWVPNIDWRRVYICSLINRLIQNRSNRFNLVKRGRPHLPPLVASETTVDQSSDEVFLVQDNTHKFILGIFPQIFHLPDLIKAESAILQHLNHLNGESAYLGSEYDISLFKQMLSEVVALKSAGN